MSNPNDFLKFAGKDDIKGGSAQPVFIVGGLGTFILSDENGNPLSIDPITGSLVTITTVHHHVHEGDFYTAGMNYTLANGEVATFAFTTPDTTKLAHMGWNLTASADGLFEVIEDVTSFSGGVVATELNHYRDSANVSGCSFLRGKTGANLITPTGGTTILSATLSSGKGNLVDRTTNAEYIFKRNSKYLFRYTNGTSANVIQLPLEWYME